ncbi:MAG: hypothetical protein U0228_34680 [Myxococcaceae bacterium]
MSDDSVLLELEGFPGFQKLPQLWELLRRDGHHFDQFSVGNTDRPLGDDPLAKLKLWTSKKGTRILKLENSSADGNHFAYFTRFTGMRSDFKLRFDWGARSPESFHAWLDELLKLGAVSEGSLRSEAIPSSNLYQHGPQASWLFFCSGAERKKLEEAGVPQFLEKHGVTVRSVKATLIFQFTKSPFEPFKGGIRSLEKPIDDLLLDVIEKKAKVDVLKVARAAFAKTLGPRGFKEVAGAERRELLWKKDTLTVAAELGGSGEYWIGARLQGSMPNSYFPWSLARGTAKQAPKLLEKALKLFEKDVERFLKNPRRFR